MTKEAKLQRRLLRCQRLLALGTIAQKAGDDEGYDRYLALYEREFWKLPLVNQFSRVHDAEVVNPVLLQFQRHGVLGMRERAVAEGWADEFD